MYIHHTLSSINFKEQYQDDNQQNRDAVRLSMIYIISYTDSWQCIWVHIHGLCSLIWPQGVSQGDIYAQAVYMSPYVKNLQDDFLMWKLCLFTFYVEFRTIYKLP